MLALGMGALITSSCTHSTTAVKRYALSGRIVYESSGQPVKGAGLALMRQPHPFELRGIRSLLEVGRSITGTNGSFSIGEGVRLAPGRDYLAIFGITPPPLPEGGDVQITFRAALWMPKTTSGTVIIRVPDSFRPTPEESRKKLDYEPSLPTHLLGI